MFVQILILWLLFYGLRILLSKSSFGQNLGDALEKFGFSCSLFHVVYETQYWNMKLYEWFNQSERWKRKFLTVWFDCGILIMFLGQILSLIALTISLFYSLQSFSYLLHNPPSHEETLLSSMNLRAAGALHSGAAPTPSPAPPPLISPIIPGINFPLKYLLDFWICTFVTILVHELGHAAAASMERLRIQGLGVFFLFLFPGAYVRIEESIQFLPMSPQLRVYSAGVWHNIVMAIFCLLALVSLPSVLSPGYLTMDQPLSLTPSSTAHWTPPPVWQAQGVVITQLLSDSPLSQSIRVGDLLVSINGHPVQSPKDFQRSDLLHPSSNLPSRVLTQLVQSIEASLLSQDDIDLVKLQQNSTSSSFTTSPSSLSFSASSAAPRSPVPPGQYSPERGSGYVVRGSGVCVSEPLLEQHLLLSKQCCKQVFLPISYSFPYSEEGMFDLTNTCYVLPSSSHNLSTDSPPSLPLGAGSIFCMSAREVQTPPNSSSPPSSRSSSLDPTISPPQRAKGVSCRSSSRCPSHSHCLFPLTSYPSTHITFGLLSPFLPLSSSFPSTTVYHYHEIIYEGTPHEVLHTLSTGSYRLRHWLTLLSNMLSSDGGGSVPTSHPSSSSLYHLLARLPDTLTLYLWLCSQLNLSVALLNMVPISILDGGMTSPQFARLLFPKRWLQISKVTEVYGGILLAGNLLMGLVLPFMSKTPQAYA
jgi:membrane-associated protease RseP (regulator of RpoE activity)